MKEFLKILYAASPLRLPVSNTIYRKSRIYGTVISIGVSVFFVCTTDVWIKCLLVTVTVFAILVLIGYIYTGTY